MSNVDDILLRLREAPVPAELDTLEGPVLAALAAGKEASTGNSLRPLAVAAIGALTIGLLGGASGSRVEAAGTTSPLSGVPHLAPSALLAVN